MHIALYRGVSPISCAIRWLTRSPFSHAAFVFDERAEAACIRLIQQRVNLHGLHFFSQGSVVEAWSGGVRNSMSISTLHSHGTRVDVFELVTPLSDLREEQLVRGISNTIGDPYSYWNVLKFITRRPGNLDGSWFCSELVFQMFSDAGVRLLHNKPAWAVPPDWLQMSPLLRFHSLKITR